MEPSPPALPRTIIVVDDYPSEVSAFLCAVLEAHALPYAVQVVDPGAPLFDHLAPREARRTSTVLWLDRLRPPWASQGLGRRLLSRGLAVLPLRRLRHSLQGRRGLAWGASLGLVVCLVVGASWWGRAERLPRVPSPPRPHSAPTVAAPPAVEALLPTQSLAPAAPVPLTGTASEPRQRAYASAARHTPSLRPQAPAPPRASQRPPAVERTPVGVPHRAGEQAAAPQAPWGQGAPNPAVEMERPWNRRLNDTGV
jgi:hypothetical protein